METENPMSTPTTNPFDNEFVLPLIHNMKTEMLFVAWFNVIYGVLASLSIIGAIVGIPLLISGLHLKDSAYKFVEFAEKASLQSLLEAITKQRTFFRVQFWFIIIGLAVFVIYLIFILFFLKEFMQEFGDSPFFT